MRCYVDKKNNFQLDIFGNWIPVEKIIKMEKLEKNYQSKFQKWLKKSEVNKNGSC